MNVIWLLLKASWLNVAIALLTGLVSGGCSAQLIALINRAISGNSTNNLVWYFAGLASLSETNSTTHSTPTPHWTTLELANVTHTYRGEKEDSHFVLGEVNLTFHPGQFRHK